MKLNILIYEHCKDLVKIIDELKKNSEYISSEKRTDLIKDLSIASRFYSNILSQTKWEEVCDNDDIKILFYLLETCYDALLRDDFYLVKTTDTKNELKKLSYYMEVSKNETKEKKNIYR